MAAFPTPRMVALMPGQSPPDDKIPIFICWLFLPLINSFFVGYHMLITPFCRIDH
jgi:hypothetical protein